MRWSISLGAVFFAFASTGAVAGEVTPKMLLERIEALESQLRSLQNQQVQDNEILQEEILVVSELQDVARDLTDRPVAMHRIIPVTWAEAGFGSVGSTTYKNFNVEYQAYLVNGLTDDFSDRGFRDARGAFGSDNNDDFAKVARLGISKGAYQFGFSAYHGEYESSRDIQAYDIDWRIGARKLEFIGEVMEFDVERGLTANGLAAPRSLRGGYAQLNWHFWPNQLNGTFLARSIASPTFTLSARYGWANIDGDGDVGVSSNNEKRWTLGSNYRPVESFVFKCEHQWNHSKSESLERGDADGLICSAAAAS